MAVTSFEVAAVFALKDEASAVLKRMSEEVKVFTKLVNEAKAALTNLGRSQLNGLNTGLKGATDQVEKMAAAFGGSFARIDAVVGSSIGEVTALARAWESVAVSAGAATKAMRGAGTSGAIAGGAARTISGYGGRSALGSSIGIPIAPGAHLYAHPHAGNAAMAGAGALAYGIYEEAQMENSIAQMLFHARMAPNAENKKRFRDLIQNTASLTGYGYHQIGEASTDAIRLMRGVPNNGIDVVPQLLRGAAAESILKGTGFKEAMKSIVEMAHMTKEYDPEQIEKFMPYFSFLSIANPATPQQMVRAASYAMPTLQSMMNVDPADVLMATTALARSGATNTKAGTWVRAGFERALPPNADTVGKAEYGRRMAAMTALGLVDESGKSTVLDKTGQHLDIDKLLATVDAKAKTMDIVDKNAYMKKVFGEQGERGVSLLMSPAVREQSATLKKEYPGFKEQYANFWDYYSQQSPVQKTRQSWQDMTNVLADIGAVALPPVVSGLQALDSALKSLKAMLPQTGDPFGPPKTGSFGEAVGKGAGAGAFLGAGTGAAFGLLGGGIGAIPGAALGAGLGAGVGAAVYGGAWMFGIDPNAASKAKDGVDKLNPAVEETGKAASSAAGGVNQLNGALKGFMDSWGGGLPSGGGLKQKMNFIAPPGGGNNGGVLHANIHIDGEKVGRSVSKYQVAMATHPNSIGSQDTYGSFGHPGTPLPDAVGG